jgi:nondiscriminating aspartyl-tRNA synthetase
MNRVFANEMMQHVGQKIHVRGWLNNIRAFGKLTFILLRDRTGLIQVVLEKKEDAALILHLQPGSILSIQGHVIASQAGTYGTELTDPKITIENPITEVSPIEYYKPQIPSDLEFILDHRSIALRNREIQAVFKLQGEIAHAYRLYMHDKVKASEYFAPNMIGSSSEGGAEFFHVDYFGHTATLAQSSQLYKQVMVGVNERVFALMPFFRAEPSQTSRHAARI